MDVEKLKEMESYHMAQAIEADEEGRDEDADWHRAMASSYYDERLLEETNDADWL